MNNREYERNLSPVLEPVLRAALSSNDAFSHAGLAELLSRCYSLGDLGDFAYCLNETVKEKVRLENATASSPIEEPEVIGDYMHYQGEDYYRFYADSDEVSETCAYCDLSDLDSCNLPCEDYAYWKNIKDIEITDELAKLRPWVLVKDNISDLSVMRKLYGVVDGLYITHKTDCDVATWEYCTLATTKNLKKAGITE